MTLPSMEQKISEYADEIKAACESVCLAWESGIIDPEVAAVGRPESEEELIQAVQALRTIDATYGAEGSRTIETQKIIEQELPLAVNEALSLFKGVVDLRPIVQRAYGSSPDIDSLPEELCDSIAEVVGQDTENEYFDSPDLGVEHGIEPVRMFVRSIWDLDSGNVNTLGAFSSERNQISIANDDNCERLRRTLRHEIHHVISRLDHTRLGLSFHRGLNLSDLEFEKLILLDEAITELLSRLQTTEKADLSGPDDPDGEQVKTQMDKAYGSGVYSDYVKNILLAVTPDELKGLIEFKYGGVYDDPGVDLVSKVLCRKSITMILEHAERPQAPCLQSLIDEGVRSTVELIDLSTVGEKSERPKAKNTIDDIVREIVQKRYGRPDHTELINQLLDESPEGALGHTAVAAAIGMRHLEKEGATALAHLGRVLKGVDSRGVSERSQDITSEKAELAITLMSIAAAIAFKDLTETIATRSPDAINDEATELASGSLVRRPMEFRPADTEGDPPGVKSHASAVMSTEGDSDYPGWLQGFMDGLD